MFRTARRRHLFSIAWIALLGCVAPAAAQAPDSDLVAGTPFRNRNAMATGNGSGQAFAVWENDRLGILARRLDSSGQGTGAVLRLVDNSPLPPVPGEADVVEHREPAAVLDRAGRLHVFWTRDLKHVRVDYFWQDSQLLERDVMGQVFDASGKPLGPAAPVHEALAGLQSRPAVARVLVRGQERILVAWSSDPGEAQGPSGIFLRRFDDAGRRLGSQIEISASRGAARPALAAGGAAETLVVWDGPGDGEGRGILARSFNPTTGALGQRVTVNQRTLGQQSQPAIAARQQSGFFVAWTGATGEGNRTRVFGRAVDASGRGVSAEVPMSSGGGRYEAAAALTTTANGIAATWLRWGDSGAEGVMAGGFDATTGAATRPEEWLNERPPLGGPYRLALFRASAGSVVALWQAPGANGWSLWRSVVEP